MRSLALLLALAAFALPASAQAPNRAVPTLFANGSCDQACANGRWTDFLKSRGEAELSGAGTVLRLTTFNAEACEGKPDRVDIRRITVGAAATEDRNACGVKKSRAIAGPDLAALTTALATPDLAELKGAFPAYCGEFEGQEDHAFHILEVLQAGRYRLIEWDCETPRPLKPLVSWLGL